jgi:hypothetical protein
MKKPTSVEFARIGVVGATALYCVFATPSNLRAQQAQCPTQTFFEFQVTDKARWIPDSSAIHPTPTSKVPQSVVQFVIDTLGVADLRTFKVLISRDSATIEDAKRLLPAWRFTPSVLNGCRVRQLMQTPIGR